jgi:hypothetical protein
MPRTNHDLAMISLPRNVLDIDENHRIEINHFRPSENDSLFNEISYFKLHASTVSDCYMQLVSPANDKVHGSIIFYKEGEHAFRSPKRGTYGGMVVYSAFDLKLLERFFTVALSHLQALGAGEVSIKSAPFSHDLALSSIMLNLLLRRGFLLHNHELNYDMRVDERPFLDRVSYGNNKRIRKCLRDGVVAEQVETSRLPIVYEVIKENRLRRGFSISMTAEQLGEMVAIFPDKVFLFAAWESEQRLKMIASAVCFAVRPSILYVFYWGDVAGVESYSPIALLASSIHGFCQSKGYRLLDVGTSTVAGEPNYGLINFKQNLGFGASLKPTYVWKK